MSIAKIAPRRILPLLARLLCLLPLAVEAAPPETAPLAAFIVAHPDDWQLFMGDVAVARVSSDAQVVFVHLTAGGADRPPAYWKTRETGSATSVSAAASWNTREALASDPHSCQNDFILAHRIHRCSYRNTVSYYLRLPDGNYDGRGFAASDHQSLARLASGEIGSIEAVDGATTYRGWGDLLDTLDSLLKRELERTKTGFLDIHSHDPDETNNPGDHSDHRSTARLVGDLASRHRLTVTGYAGYAISRLPMNLSAQKAAAKMLVFMSYDQQRLLANMQWSAYAEEPAAYSSWQFRTYGRRLEVGTP